MHWHVQQRLGILGIILEFYPPQPSKLKRQKRRRIQRYSSVRKGINWLRSLHREVAVDRWISQRKRTNRLSIWLSTYLSNLYTYILRDLYEQLTHMVMEAEVSWYPVGQLKTQDSQLYKSHSKNSKSLMSSSSSEAERRFSLLPPFCSLKAWNGLDDNHPHWKEWSTFKC